MCLYQLLGLVPDGICHLSVVRGLATATIIESLPIACELLAYGGCLLRRGGGW